MTGLCKVGAGRRAGFTKCAMIVVMAASMVWAAPCFAGGWFSGIATSDGRTIPFSALEVVDIASSLKANGPTFIDLTVTLTEQTKANEADPDYPAGDDDGNAQATPLSQQDRYEQVRQPRRRRRLVPCGPARARPR
jgi:hypothetical protein